MVKNFKSFIAGFISCAVLMGGIIGFAAGDAQIKATLLNTFNFKLYGNDYSVKNSSGGYLKPILYNKTPYIPLQSVVDGLGVPVEYDTANKTIWLGGKTSEVPVVNKNFYTDYSKSIITKDSNKLSTPDITYKWGITNLEKLDMDHFGCYLAPGGKYNRFKASLFIDEDVKAPLTITFYKDSTKTGEALGSYELKPGEAQDVEFDIGGVDKIQMHTWVNIQCGDVTKLIVGEPTFFNEKPEAESEETNNR